MFSQSLFCFFNINQQLSCISHYSCSSYDTDVDCIPDSPLKCREHLGGHQGKRSHEHTSFLESWHALLYMQEIKSDNNSNKSNSNNNNNNSNTSNSNNKQLMVSYKHCINTASNQYWQHLTNYIVNKSLQTQLSIF